MRNAMFLLEFSGSKPGPHSPCRGLGPDNLSKAPEPPRQSDEAREGHSQASLGRLAARPASDESQSLETESGRSLGASAK